MHVACRSADSGQKHSTNARVWRGALGTLVMVVMLLLIATVLGCAAAQTACTVNVATSTVSSWDNGYTASVVVSNPGPAIVTGWRASVSLGTGSLSGQPWSCVLQGVAAGVATFSGPAWQLDLAPGASFSFGFNVNGPSSQLASACGAPAPAPATTAPATTAPATTAPATTAPATTAPNTPAPNTPAPNTPAPNTPAPNTPAPNPANAPLSTTAVGDPVARFQSWVSTLTTLPSGTFRAVHSSGGAAGGVVSEGQGYGLLMGGIVVASLPATHPQRAWAVQTTYELFQGWKQMCKLSAGGGHCQSNFYCSGSPCLPHWKFDDAITSAQGTGSAVDGDEDAMLGMILFVKALQASPPPFWNEVADWAQQTCHAFFDYGTVSNGAGTARAPKLGSCWGGWDCSNPSYWSPAAYRACSDYLQQRSGPALDWTTLLRTTYQLAAAAQCPATGLVPNWYVPNANDPSVPGTTGCSGSGTPAAQFGAEASRLVWRMAADYVLYGTAEGRAFSVRAQAQATQADLGNGAWGALQTVLRFSLAHSLSHSRGAAAGLSGAANLQRLVQQRLYLRAAVQLSGCAFHGRPGAQRRRGQDCRCTHQRLLRRVVADDCHADAERQPAAGRDAAERRRGTSRLCSRPCEPGLAEVGRGRGGVGRGAGGAAAGAAGGAGCSSCTQEPQRCGAASSGAAASRRRAGNGGVAQPRHTFVASLLRRSQTQIRTRALVLFELLHRLTTLKGSNCVLSTLGP